MGLTVKAVEAAKPMEKDYKLTDGRGLYLFVRKTGSKVWRANYLDGGRQKTRTYGQYPQVSLADARRAHSDAREAKSQPGETNGPAPHQPTFKEVAERWLKKHLPGLSNGKHQVQVANTLERFAYPALGGSPISSITRKQLVAVVEIAQEGDRIETAHRLAGRVTSVFNHAVDMGLLDSHPAQGLTRVLKSKKVKKPMAAIDQKDTGKLMRSIAEYPEEITKLALQLSAHTFVRTKELRGMRWGEFKEDGAVWVIPAERMKLRLPHVVPMSTQARTLLARLKHLTGESELVLESPDRPGSPLSENTMLFALYRLGYRGQMTVHGFRSLASTVLNESGKFERDVIERQLSHQESDSVRAAYNRAEYLSKRRELMQWWSDWLDSQVENCTASSKLP